MPTSIAELSLNAKNGIIIPFFVFKLDSANRCGHIVLYTTIVA